MIKDIATKGCIGQNRKIKKDKDESVDKPKQRKIRVETLKKIAALPNWSEIKTRKQNKIK